MFFRTILMKKCAKFSLGFCWNILEYFRATTSRRRRSTPWSRVSRWFSWNRPLRISSSKPKRYNGIRRSFSCVASTLAASTSRCERIRYGKLSFHSDQSGAFRWAGTRWCRSTKVSLLSSTKFQRRRSWPWSRCGPHINKMLTSRLHTQSLIIEFRDLLMAKTLSNLQYIVKNFKRTNPLREIRGLCHLNAESLLYPYFCRYIAPHRTYFCKLVKELLL